MRIIFMGTPEFAVPTLTALHEAGHTVVGVFTQPDKPKGRGYELTPPAVKVEALRLGLDVYQPRSVKTPDALELFESLDAEVAVVVAYGKLLPQSLLDAPKYGCINMHASLLPKYRGAAPIQWAVINGEKVSGVTSMQMNAGLDTGDMLLTEETQIGENETAGQLHDRLSLIGAQLAVRTLEALEKGELVPKQQDDALSCYAPMLDKSLCAVDWTATAQTIHDKIRGLSPWPVATASLDGKVFKLHSSVLCKKTGKGKPGEIISQDPLIVQCGDGELIRIIELQAPNGKRMKSEDYFRGHKVPEGSVFD